MNIAQEIKKQEELMNDDTNQARNEVEQRELKRYRNYTEFWKLYRGQHWGYEEEEEDSPTPVFNKTFIFVNKSISFLVGKPPTVNYTNEIIEKLLAPYVNLILKNSGGINHLTFEAIQMGSVTGDLFIKIAVDSNWKVKLIVLDSQDVSVKYSFNSYSSNIPDRATITWKFIDTDNKIKTKKEVWSNSELMVYVDAEVILAESGPNILGVVPIIHVRNIPIGKEPYGMSDIEQLESLNKLLNSSIRRFKNDVEYCGDPITLLYGARVSAVEKGEGKLWGNLPFKSRVENLTLDTDFPAQQKFIEYLDSAAHEIGNVPKDLVVGSSKISNTSGIALYMLNLPILESTDRKRTQYGQGFERAIQLALKIMLIVEQKRDIIVKQPAETLDVEEKTLLLSKSNGITKIVNEITKLYSENDDLYVKLKDWYEIEFKFTDYLPKDRLIELQAAREELTLGIASRKEIMKRLGKDNIEDLLEEIDEEIEQILKVKEAYKAVSISNKSEGTVVPEDKKI